MDEKRIQNIMEQYKCNREDALVVIYLRDEGYSMHQATVMAGVADPYNDSEE